MTSDYLIYKYIKSILNNKYNVEKVYYKDLDEKAQICAGVFQSKTKGMNRELMSGSPLSHVGIITLKFNVSSYKETILLLEEDIESLVSSLLQTHNKEILFDEGGNIIEGGNWKYRVYIGQFDPVIDKGYLGKNEFEIAQYHSILQIHYTTEVK